MCFFESEKGTCQATATTSTMALRDLHCFPRILMFNHMATSTLQLLKGIGQIWDTRVLGPHRCPDGGRAGPRIPIGSRDWPIRIYILSRNMRI